MLIEDGVKVIYMKKLDLNFMDTLNQITFIFCLRKKYYIQEKNFKNTN